MPNAEGVYTIHVAASKPSGFAERFWAASTRLAERTFQVVVFDPHPPAAAAGARWESVLEIDPTNPRWVERLPSWSQVGRIPGFNHGPLGNSRAVAVDLPLGRFVELASSAPAADPHWQAYSLPLEAVGVPHMLEIDYPADSEQHFGLSIVEPNASGVVAGINRDAGVYVEGLGRSEAKQKQTERMVFWPRTQSPLLVVSNLHPAAAAHFGQIRVFKRSTNQLNTGPAGDTSHERLIAAYLARPTVAEVFGATRAVDGNNDAPGSSAGCVDDCETAYQGATRLADYVRYSGYNSAIVNVNLSGTGRAPMPAVKSAYELPGNSNSAAEKSLDVDGVELMLRVFDREQIALLPAIEFAAPLPQLETLRRNSDPHTSGLEWVGPDGRTWLETNGNRHGLAPYYNLLEPRVQQAMLEIVRDLTRRYGAHRAFTGLAIQLSSDGYDLLPPLDWGMDDATIGRFERDTRIQLADTGPERFAARHAQLTDQYAAAWRSWRTAQVSAFYTQLASLVRGNSERRLVLTTENVFANPQLAARMRPNVLAENATNRMASALVEVGLDRAALERIPGVVLCPTRYVAPTTPLPDSALALELNDAIAFWRQPSTPALSRATSLYHRPVRQRLVSFEVARTPWRVAGEMQLVSQPLPEGAAARQPYLQSLVENDPAVLIDGGELLPLGQEDLLRDVRTTLAQLPTAADVTDLAKQPITVRTYSEANRVTLVAMNMSPWHCDAQIMLDVPQAANLTPIITSGPDGAPAAKPIALAAGRQSWPLSLGPYEIRAARIPIAGTKVLEIQTDVGDAAIAELAAKITDLNDNRDLTAPSIYQALANPSFELLSGAGRLPGWHLVGKNATATADLDPTNPQDGKTSLHLRTSAQPIVVESEAFPIPPTGQLAMTVFVRSQNLGPNTELRLVFEADCDGQIYRRPASVQAKDMRVDGQWGPPFAILVPDLPLQSRGQMRVAFELSGPGEVWLDNAKLYDLLFPLKFYANAQREVFELLQQIHAAKSAFDARQTTDCLRILDGYWPRFILAYRPPVQAQIVEKAAPKTQTSPPQSNEGQESAPGISEHIKRFVPILR